MTWIHWALLAITALALGRAILRRGLGVVIENPRADPGYWIALALGGMCVTVGLGIVVTVAAL